MALKNPEMKPKRAKPENPEMKPKWHWKTLRWNRKELNPKTLRWNRNGCGKPWDETENAKPENPGVKPKWQWTTLKWNRPRTKPENPGMKPKEMWKPLQWHRQILNPKALGWSQNGFGNLEMTPKGIQPQNWCETTKGACEKHAMTPKSTKPEKSVWEPSEPERDQKNKKHTKKVMAKNGEAEGQEQQKTRALPDKISYENLVSMCMWARV